jgi:hypothetical protein
MSSYPRALKVDKAVTTEPSLILILFGGHGHFLLE